MVAPAPKPSITAEAKSWFSKFDTLLHTHPKTAAILVAIAANFIGVIFHI